MAITNYTFGDNVTGAFDDTTGVLIVSGSGTMNDFGGGTSPIFNIKDLILDIIIQEGITKVGDYTFSNCEYLSSVTIPESMKNIGIGAFEYTALTTVNLPSQLEILGVDAFKESKLTTIVVPELITEIPPGAFGYCYDLQSITIPNAVTSIGLDAFIFCFKLSEITNLSKTNQTIGRDAFYDAGSNITPRTVYAFETNTNFITAAQAAGYEVILLQSGLDIYVITYNETTQQKELKQVEEIKVISGTNETKVLENVSEFKIITDTGLK